MTSACPAEQRRPRVLVAEDDRSLRRLLELQLTVEGYDVRTVEDGNDAIDMVTSWQPEVLLCDVMMPHVSGLTVCRQLRSRAATARLPIVLLTARCFDADIEAVLSLGGISFLGKPFNAGDLHATLRSVLPTGHPAGES